MPNRVAFENMGGSGLRLRGRSDCQPTFAAYLQNELGLKKGERDRYSNAQSASVPDCIYRVPLKAGLIVVNTNPLYTPREMEHQFKDAGMYLPL
ncbi:MAG: hypothetical protein U5K54_00305 [Cytophagales bacterium]|nr:hypothetical protein [Cytophagales bacterium]